MGEVMRIFFDEFCRDKKQCEHYIEWDWVDEVYDHGHRYEMGHECCSCELVGQSENVDTFNEFCPHLKEIKVEEKRLIKKYKAWEKKQEQEAIWQKLNA